MSTPGCPNVTDYLAFIRDDMDIGALFLPDDSPWIQATLDIGKGTVNLAILRVNAFLYTQAVYNCAGDRLMNFATDVSGQTFFRGKRNQLGLTSWASGLVGSSSDNSGSSQSLEVIEAAKRMTISDLQMMKTPWGRTYLGIAQDYGSNLWGLT